MDVFIKFGESLILLSVALLMGLLLHIGLFRTAATLADRSESSLDDSLVRRLRSPLRLVIPLLCIHFFFPLMGFPARGMAFLKHSLGLVLIASIAWILIRLVYVAEDMAESRFRMDVEDNLQARKIHTQLQIFKKIAIAVVSLLALSSMLMTFEKIRYLGTSILASAGIAGLLVGLAAQRSIATLFAGIQIAVTQPIRVDDVVIVEGEWGRIEEITLTYVVLKIWDERRLLLPITYFIEKPFQNWTRVTADILGTVFIYLDYTVPVEVVREELFRILDGSELWDGRVRGLQVTDATANAIELRALMSAANASKAWNLRCEVREKLVEFVRSAYPAALPRFRAEIRKP